MRILGIDTAIPRASVAIVEDGRLLSEETQGGAGDRDDPRDGSLGKHAEVLLPLIQSLLERVRLVLGDLSGLSVSIGPGSFTGLRIGLATAKGIAYESNLPLFGVSTLHANAVRVSNFEGLIGSLIDARKGEVYAALFRCAQSDVVRLTPDAALSVRSTIDLIREYQEDGGLAFLVGGGAKSYEQQLCEALGSSVRISSGACYPSVAAQVARLAGARAARGDVEDVGAMAPVYLRVAEAEKQK